MGVAVRKSLIARIEVTGYPLLCRFLGRPAGRMELGTAVAGIGEAPRHEIDTRLGNHHELAHHATVLVFEHVAMVHVGNLAVREILELHDQTHQFARLHQNRILVSALIDARFLSVAFEDKKMNVVDVEGMGQGRRVHDFPYLDIAQFHGFIDSSHVERLAVDGEPPLARGSHGKGDLTDHGGVLFGERFDIDQPLGNGDVFLRRFGGPDFYNREGGIFNVFGVFDAFGDRPGIVGETMENHVFTVRDVNDNFGPFPGAQKHSRHLDRRLQQAAAGADLVKRSFVVETEVVDSRVGTVQDPKSDPPRGSLKKCLGRAVDQDHVAAHAQDVIAVLGHVTKSAILVEGAVLNHQRNIVDAVVLWKIKRERVVVLDDEQTGDSHVSMLAGFMMGMGMVPVERRLLHDSKMRPPSVLGRDLLGRTAIHGGRNVQAMPMYGGRDPGSVGDEKIKIIAFFRSDRRSKIIAVHAKRGGSKPRQKFFFAGLEFESDDPAIAQLLSLHQGRDDQGIGTGRRSRRCHVSRHRDVKNRRDHDGDQTQFLHVVFCPPSDQGEVIAALAISFSVWQCAGHGDAAGLGFVH